jgi:hypothetical protein
LFDDEVLEELIKQSVAANNWWYAGMPMQPPPSPQATKKRTRKLPAWTWHWSEAEPKLRRAILQTEVRDHDQIDPDKPFLVTEEAGWISIVQEVE